MSFREFCAYALRQQFSTSAELQRFEEAIRPLPLFAVPSSLDAWITCFEAWLRIESR